MYPTTELNELGTRKVVLRQRIALRRWQVAIDARRAAQPLVLIDRAYAQWRRISPVAKVAAVPLLLLLKKSIFPRARVSRSVWRFVPTLVGALWRAKTRANERAYAGR